MVARVMLVATDPWWIIGSAAVVLHGSDGVVPADVDVLVSKRDARRVLSDLGLTALPGTASALFRSLIFARWTDPPLAVEFMARFDIATDRGWMEILPTTRERFVILDDAVFVPSKPELIDILRLFGRPKDLDRAAAIGG